MSAAVVELRRIELPDVERQGVQASLSTSEASISPRSPGFPERGPGFLLLYLRYRAFTSEAGVARSFQRPRRAMVTKPRFFRF